MIKIIQVGKKVGSEKQKSLENQMINKAFSTPGGT